MLSDFDFATIGPEACAALAQILPVLLVALIAERIVFKGARTRSAARFLAVLARVLIDVGIVVTLLVLTAVALVGVETQGYAGEDARSLWALSGLIALVVVYRWMLLSTPLLELSRLVGLRAAEASVSFLLGLSEALARLGGTAASFSAGLSEGMIAFSNGLVLTIARVVDSVITVFGSVLTLGLTDGVFNVAHRLAERLRSKKRTDERVGRGEDDPRDG